MSSTNGSRKVSAIEIEVRPETVSAILWCEGRCKSPVRHTFSKSTPLDHDGLFPTSFRMIYDCNNCGAPRVWGTHSEKP